MFDDGSVERTSDATLEPAVDASEREHAGAVTTVGSDPGQQADFRLGERPRLVRAQHVHGAEIMNGRKPLDDHLAFRHAQCAARETHRHHHRQQLRREADSKSGSEQEQLDDGAAEGKVSQQHEQRQEDGQAHDQQAEPVNAALKGARLLIAGERRGDTAEAGGASGGDNEHGRLSAHHGCACEQRIERVGRHGGVARSGPFFRRVRLARHQCFVHMRVAALQHDAVSRDQIAGAQRDDVAGNDLVDGCRNDGLVAQNVGMHRHRALESVGCDFGAMLLHDIKTDRQADDRHDDRDAREIAGEPGDHSRDQQDRHQRLREPSPNLGREVDSGLVADPIWAETPDPLLGLGTGEAGCTALRALEERLLGQAPEVIRRRCHGPLSSVEIGIHSMARVPAA